MVKNCQSCTYRLKGKNERGSHLDNSRLENNFIWKIQIIETEMFFFFFFAWRDSYDCLPPSLEFVGTVMSIGISLTNRKLCIIHCEACVFLRAKLLSSTLLFPLKYIGYFHYKSNFTLI